MTSTKLSVHDPDFVEKIIYEVKSQGHFDAFRKECLADVDTQPAFQNLHSRVEDSVQKFLNRQVWTPETNKNRLREDMRYNIVRAGYLESGVDRIVEQIVEQKFSSIQAKVEEILYHYVGIEKPIKKEKHEPLEIETDLLPTDLEQVSPDSDKKSSTSGVDVKDEEIEEEIVEDEDFESPAFEPIEAIVLDKNETSMHSNLSAISGLTSQDSAENKSEPTTPTAQEVPNDSQLSQISSIQDMSQEACEEPPIITEEDGKTFEEPKAVEVKEPPVPEEPEKSQFDLKKDTIEFTGTERKSMNLDDSTNSGEGDKILQPQDVPSNTMEIDNLYENYTTDSSEMRMEIDLKDETTQETADSSQSKVEESSQDSTVSKDKEKEKSKTDHRKDSHHRHHHKSDRSRDKHKSSSSHRSSNHNRSSSSKHHDDKSKSRTGGKSSSSSHKKSSSDRHRSSSGRRDHDKDKDRKSTRDESKSKHKDSKPTDDHHQEKSASRRRRSTDHDSNEGKTGPDKSKGTSEIASSVVQETPTQSEPMDTTPTTDKNQDDSKVIVLDQMLNQNCELSINANSSNTKKEARSSILVKYDYLKSPPKSALPFVDIKDGFCGFTAEKLPDNPWFHCLRKDPAPTKTKAKIRRASNNNYLEQKKLENSLAKPKPKAKSKSPGDHPAVETKTNGVEEISTETRAQAIAQQQRYTDEDLYKPRFDFGNRTRRRGQVTDETTVAKPEEVST